MRIAIVSESPTSTQDNVGNILLHLLEYLETHGHTSLVLTPSGVPINLGRTRVEGIGNLWQPGEPYDRLQDELNQFQPELLHVLQPSKLGVDGMRAGRQLGLPVLASYHSEILELGRLWGFGTPSDLMWSYFRVLHDLADLSLAPTYFHQMQLREQGFERVRAWTQGVDGDLFSPKRRSSAWRRHLSDGEPNKTLLVYAGTLAYEKHVELLRPVIEGSEDCRLAIVGAGPEAAWLRDFFEGTPTLFTGYLDKGDLAEVLASADAFVQPATPLVSPTTTLEAMASGLPVIAPHSASILDFAVHGENALLFTPGDTQAQRAYVRQLTEKPRLAQDLGRVARATAQARSWQISLGKLVNIYKNLVSQGSMGIPMGSFQSLPLTQVHN